MKNWETGIGGYKYYCSLEPDQVVVGSTTGHHFSDNAGVCTYEEFLAGRFQDLILRDMGEQVLNEVVAEVKRLVAERNS